MPEAQLRALEEFMQKLTPAVSRLKSIEKELFRAISVRSTSPTQYYK